MSRGCLQVLRDIAAPDDGLYSVRDPMENRLTYVRWQMDNILSDPAIKVSIMGKGARVVLFMPFSSCLVMQHQLE